MEIEAKFSIPDADTFQRLEAVGQLAGFALSAGQTDQVRDTYLDTQERLILAAGYACRRRAQAEGLLITLKGLGGAKGPIHRREELETQMPTYRPPAEWPASPARDRVLELIGEAPLVSLFDLQQVRSERLVSRDQRPVAQLSLDDVHLAADGRELSFFELEVELVPQGNEEDLAAIANCLQDKWSLEPEALSKFERALAFLEETPPAEKLLSPQERVICGLLVEQGDSYGRRAAALLALDEGVTQAVAGQRAGMSARQVRRWLAEFRKRGLGIFPKRVLDQDRATPEEPVPEPEKYPRPTPLDVQFKAAPTGEVEVITHHPEAQPFEIPRKPPKTPGLEPDDSMSEAARKTFWLHFRRMLYHEPGTRLGEDIEELHDMRVATRRMRAAFQVFGDYLDMEQMAPFFKGLRRTGRALGAVRDLDVFWEKTQHYLDTLPPDRAGDLDPLRRVWEAEREAARERMLVYLDSKRYAQFKEEFGEFLRSTRSNERVRSTRSNERVRSARSNERVRSTRSNERVRSARSNERVRSTRSFERVQSPGVLSQDGAPVPHRLRHVVPATVYQRLAAVWAYDEWVTRPGVPQATERLHQLRIAAKGLRYTLEFFQEVLGPEAETLIDQIKALQDHLGHLQDAVVASNLLRDFLTWGTWGHKPTQDRKDSLPTEPVIAPGVAVYLAARQTELLQLLHTFPQVWDGFQNHEFSQLVTSALSPLFGSHPFVMSTTSQKGENMTTEPKYFVLLGPPASGKGTQATQLREALSLPHVASGDLFRENLKNETELGRKAKVYMDRGELVPDDITIAMVMDRLSRPDCDAGALLDGFPRTIAQAEALDQALAAQAHKISLVLYITVPDDVLVERVSGRRICRACGESYHINYNPPKQPGVCDHDEGELYQRDDDQPETVRQRLKVYWEQTSPLTDYYRAQGVLIEINGDQSIEEVQTDLRAAVDEV